MDELFEALHGRDAWIETLHGLRFKLKRLVNENRAILVRAIKEKPDALFGFMDILDNPTEHADSELVHIACKHTMNDIMLQLAEIYQMEEESAHESGS
jgi:hypothetical protein